MSNIKDLERSFLTQVKTRKEELSTEISQHDMAISDILHYLENEKCDAVDMVRAAKKLKEIQKNRRKVKIEREQALCLLRLVNESNILKYECDKKYKYRTTAVNDVRKK